jgi:hypothetical protein
MKGTWAMHIRIWPRRQLRDVSRTGGVKNLRFGWGFPVTNAAAFREASGLPISLIDESRLGDASASSEARIRDFAGAS